MAVVPALFSGVNNILIFNTILGSSRVVIEQAFGSLKGRFRRLKGIETLCVEAVSETVIAACIIHNMCSDSDQGNFRLQKIFFLSSLFNILKHI